MKENYEIVNSPAHQAFQHIWRSREGYNKKSVKSKVPSSSIRSPFSTIPFDDTRKSVARADLNVQKPLWTSFGFLTLPIQELNRVATDIASCPL